MADPISLASGLLALSNFALQSSITLHNTIRSFKIHLQSVRDLKQELEALEGVLNALGATVSATTNVDLSALDLPLLRCGNACKDFESEILKCSSRSGGDRTSFRDWARLRYMGEDINGFRQLLAGYKSTINIALTDANLRKSSVTAENIEGYRDLITTATNDLEAHLQSIDEKLDTIFSRTVTASNSDSAELRLMKEERKSTQQCLQICAQLSEHINQIQSRPIERDSSHGPVDVEALPERIINEGLQECKENLRATTVKLEGYMKQIIDRFTTKSKTAMTSDEEVADLCRLREEWETARHSISICSKAEDHLKENVSIIDNYATGDETVQFLVSTDGNIIHGKNRGLGYRNMQVGGHLNDTSLQQISQDLSRISSPATGNDGPSSKDTDAMKHESVPEFGERYGRGFKLTSKPSPDMTLASKPAEESGLCSSSEH